MQIGILEPENFSIQAISDLKKLGEVHLNEEDKIEKFISNKDVLFIRLAHMIDRRFLDNAQKLKIICTPTTGLNHIDLEECESRGIKIVSLKGESKFLNSIRATPEHAIGLTLSLLRNYKTAFLNNENTEWNREKYKGKELYLSKVGIVGFGRVGRILAQYFNAFGSKVFFHDVDETVQQFEYVTRCESLKELITVSDIVILAVNFTKENYRFFGAKYLNLLKNKYFINISRGELLDEKLLLSLIKKNFFSGVAVDVIENEQTTKNNLSEFINCTVNRNLIVTPHIGGATFDSMQRTEVFIVKKLIFEIDRN